MKKTDKIIFIFVFSILAVFFLGREFKKENKQVASIVKTQELVPQKTQKDVKSQEIEGTKQEEKTGIFYRVIRVVDGDTLVLKIDGENQTLRLIGIDTPETVDPRKPVQCFGKEASAKAKETLTGQRVRIEKDDSQGELDKYGRLLIYVFLKDGTNFNKMMIEQGYAHEYTYNLPYKYQIEFKQAEKIARKQKRGLWAENTCAGDTTKAQEIPVVGQEMSPIQINTVKIAKNDCSANVYNCTDFKTHAEAQATYDYCGGINNDIHRLDKDKDGKACESLP